MAHKQSNQDVDDRCPACNHDIKLHDEHYNGHATRIYCMVGSFSAEGCPCDGFNKIQLTPRRESHAL